MKTVSIPRVRSLLFGVSLGLAALITELQVPAAHAATEQANGCLSIGPYLIPVNLSSNDPTVYHIAGWLYSQGPVEGKTIQVVIHGATYDHHYFDFPYQPAHYSYVDYLTGAGYAVLDIDRIGVGRSDHPTNPEEVTLTAEAYAIHQIVQGLRDGTIAGVKFKKVMLVGHSLGSGISMIEAGTYMDVDAVILSGFANAVNPSIASQLSSAEEANSDAEFANLPDGYYIFASTVREQYFYNAPDANPKVIALDQILQQTLTDGEETQFLSTFTTNTYSSLVNVPVLIANGSDDAVFGTGVPFNGSDPNSIKSFEATFFTAVPSLSVFVLNNAGHCINLHLNSPDWFNAARAWSDQYVGPQ